MIQQPSNCRPCCLRSRAPAWSPRSAAPWWLLLGGLLVAMAGCTQGRWAWWNAAPGDSDAVATAAPSDADASFTVTPGSESSSLAPPTIQEATYDTAGGPTRAQGVASSVADGSSDGASATYEVATNASAARPDSTEFEDARIMARVGGEVILAGDLMGPINQALEPYLDKMPKEHIEMQRDLLLRQQVKMAVDNKLLYVSALRAIPLDKRAEALPQIWQRLHEKFDEEELQKAIERAKVGTAAELDAKLRQYGWSLAKQRRQYAERQIGMSGAADAVNKVPEITHQDLLAYYQEHSDVYSFPAQARWEQMSVRFDRVEDRQQAYQQISAMGNEVALGGAPFWAVAKRSSHDSNASQGGQYDWTTQGSLVSEPLDEAIFSLPVGKLSQIIEDERGYHIVRVIERRAAGRTPFTEAQAEIRKKIEGEKRQEAYRQYLEGLRRDIPVWTVFDDEDQPAAETP